MQRIHLPYLYDIATSLEPLKNLKDEETPFMDIFMHLLGAESTVKILYETSVFTPHLRISLELAGKLLETIRKYTAVEKPFEQKLYAYDIFLIKTAYSHFRIALLAEMGSLNTYLTAQKAGYDMYALLTNGEVIFPESLPLKVPEALDDAREAAKALAYEIPTACGFHVFRVTESVLRRYYLEATGSKSPPKVRNIGVYVNSMRQSKKGDERILSAVKQMTDLHRNPLIHPEVILTTQEAISVLGMVCSVVTAMLAVLPELPKTNSVVINS